MPRAAISLRESITRGADSDRYGLPEQRYAAAAERQSGRVETLNIARIQRDCRYIGEAYAYHTVTRRVNRRRRTARTRCKSRM
ncbi:MAG: hypothetical protein ACRDHP_05485 [Ktedonobacterales bacterium]